MLSIGVNVCACLCDMCDTPWVTTRYASAHPGVWRKGGAGLGLRLRTTLIFEQRELVVLAWSHDGRAGLVFVSWVILWVGCLCACMRAYAEGSIFMHSHAYVIRNTVP